MLPNENSKLRKLRHLSGINVSLMQLEDGIGGMTSLQTLSQAILHGYGVRELEKLKHLRDLGLLNVRGENGSALSSSINKMQHLEKLLIESKSKYKVIDLHFTSSPMMLRELRLYAKLEKLPKWIPELQNLVVLTLKMSQLTDD